jgi:hypothetical protein
LLHFDEETLAGLASARPPVRSVVESVGSRLDIESGPLRLVSSIDLSGAAPDPWRQMILDPSLRSG